MLEADDEDTLMDDDVFASAESIQPPEPVSQSMLSKVLQTFETKIMMHVDARIDKSDKKLDSFLEDHAMKRELDIYTFADQAERLDHASNLLKTSSVLITG